MIIVVKKMITKNLILLILILLGLIVRLLLTPLPGFKIDVDDWFAWAIRLSHFNFAQFYSKDIFTDYTPGYLYILGFLGFLKNLLALESNLFYILLKLPAILADLIIGIFVYQETKKIASPKIALLTLLFVIFNPVVIFNSSVWGQIDSILTLLMLVTIMALKKSNLLVSSAFFGLALLVKPQALALTPLLAFFLINNFSLTNLFKLAVPGSLVIFILTFPFFPNQTLINLFQHVANTAAEYPYTSLNAYNFWGIIGFWISDQTIWNILSFQHWGYILFAIYWITMGYFYFKKKISLYALATLATLGFFFLPTKVHERYLYPAIIFLILLASIYKSKALLILTSLLSFLHLFNLYYVYVYYNEIYFQLPKLFYNPLLYYFLAEHSKNLSLISTILFILISITIIQHETTNKEN